MVKHNNVVPNQHFHKKWDRKGARGGPITTWFKQPLQKKARREKRKLKAAAIAPRPASGPLKPVVHCPTQKYNSKVRFGRGFSLAELKEAKISPKFALTVGISVDHRRINKSQESLAANVDRLTAYKARLIVFPRKGGMKKGDATKEERSQATQIKGPIIPLTATEPALTYTTITDEMKAFNAHSTLRIARNEKRMKGKREKAVKDKESAEK